MLWRGNKDPTTRSVIWNSPYFVHLAEFTKQRRTGIRLLSHLLQQPRVNSFHFSSFQLQFQFLIVFFYSLKRIIKNSKKIAAIEPELPSNYLSQEVEPIKITETKKSYICFESRIISSLYPESNALFSLSHVFQRNNEQDGQLEVKLDSTTNQVLEVIQRLPHSLCIAFFPPILNLLLKILVCGSDTVASLSFICIISVLKKLVF